jgi:hypothetical protein
VGKGSGVVRSKRDEPLKTLRKLTKIQREIWDEMIEPAWWLTPWDRPKAHMWVELMYEQLTKGKAMPTPRYRELRMLSTELGLDTAEQARQGIVRPEDEDPTERFFD